MSKTYDRRWGKTPATELSDATIARVKRLSQFRVTENGPVFRSVRYYEVSKHRLVMEFFQGQTTSRTIARSGRLLASSRTREQVIEVVRLSGRWLGHFHQWGSWASADPYSTELRIKRSIANTRRLAAMALPAKLVDRLTDRLASSDHERADNIVVTIHGDFKPANVMSSGDEIVGVDMEGYGPGHPLIDLGQYIVNIMMAGTSLMLWTGRLAWWRELSQQFLAEYHTVVPWETKGLRSQILDSLLATMKQLGNRHNYVFWRLRGLPLAVRTLSAFLDSSLGEL